MAWSCSVVRALAAASHLLAAGQAATLAVQRREASQCPGYTASNVQSDGNSTTANLNLGGPACNAYGTDLSDLRLEVEHQTPQRLHVKIYDAGTQVYQVPESVLPRPENNNIAANQSDLQFSMTESPFSFAVTRRSTNETLFNTSGSPLIFESQYVNLRTQLPDNPNLYGLGETTDDMRLSTNGYVRTLWSRDAPNTPQHSNLYGNHPVYYDYRSTGTHGVFLLNSNGMDIKINNDTSGQYLEYNTLGGIVDLYFLSGPEPRDVAVQYSEVVGKAAMMPYWGFGFHNCRYGYRDAYEVAETVANYSAAQIPLETQWTDIDYMDLRRVFSLDPFRYNLSLVRDLVSTLHSNDQHYIVMVDPAVAYRDYAPFNNGVNQSAFLNVANGSTYKGVVWPGVTAFPDWFAPNVQQYWNGEFNDFFNANSGVDIDALWIDMNEASNFCTFPCNDPEAYAAQSGNPPSPPTVRIGPPRNISGFGSAFQPQCHAIASFNVKAQANPDETILILGNSPTLGNGDVEEAPPLFNQGNNTWLIDVDMPANSQFTYEYVRKASNGTFSYESMNRTVATGDCGSPLQVIQDTIGATSPQNGKSKRTHTPTIRPTVHQLSRRQSGDMLGLPNRNLLSPQYTINDTAGSLSESTIQTNIFHSNGLALYDTHNLYGTMMSSASRTAMLSRRPNDRPLVITRSTFAGAGAHVGHWTGDNVADWDHYRWAIAEIQEFAGLFQVPMVGSDICGFSGNTTDDLCARWAFVGAFSPFFRDHSNLGSNPHPLYMSDLVASAGRAAVNLRYTLLDYMYTAFWRQTQTGLPLINPMFFMYPNDTATASLQWQFFYGDCLLVAPVTEENSTDVTFYLPSDQFYDFFTYEPITGNGSNMTASNVGYTTVPLYYKGGSIVPFRTESANTTTALRQKNFNVVIAPSANGTSAVGSLYLDDGNSLNQTATSLIDFTYSEGSFNMSGTFDYDPGNVVLENVILLGQSTGGMNGTYNSTTRSTTYGVNASLRQPGSFRLM